MNEAGLTSPDQNLPATVHVKHAQNRQGKTLHFYLNYSSSPQEVPYPYASGMNLLSQRSVTHDQSFVLQPWDAAIVEEK
ncbi:MAG TPA: Beta-galactosidase C-terminal domain [Candidatus Acidoferrum sp.]|nr:Beta-galactosidase C-terminal domain [Candidatus Acidoferrum sp.]